MHSALTVIRAQANEKMQDAVSTDYPIAFVLSIGGFVFILGVEELVVWYQEHSMRKLEELAAEAFGNGQLESGRSCQASFAEESRVKDMVARGQLIAAMNPRTSLLVDGQVRPSHTMPPDEHVAGCAQM